MGLERIKSEILPIFDGAKALRKGKSHAKACFCCLCSLCSLVAIAPCCLVKKVKFDFKGYRGSFYFNSTLCLFIGEFLSFMVNSVAFRV